MESSRLIGVDAARRLVELARSAAPSAGATRVLAIDGRSGVGKSTLAAALAADEAVGGRVGVISMEDLYEGWDGLAAGIELAHRAVLAPLAAGAEVWVPRYDWVAGAWADPRPLGAVALLILEGVGAGARALAPLSGPLVWLEAPAAERASRTLARDGVRFAAQRPSWAAQERAYIASERPRERAALVIETTGES